MAPQSTGEGRQRHFVLVHGVNHGAWCWTGSEVPSLLEKAGHKVSVVELAGCGDSPLQPDDLTTFEEYNQPLVDLFNDRISADEKVIVVGHSMGCLNVTSISEQFPEKIAAAVHVAGPMLNNVSFNDSGFHRVDEVPLSMDLTFKNGPNAPPTSALVDENCFRTIFYQLSPAKDIDFALAHVRPSPLFLATTTITHTQERYGKVPRVYIHVDGDLATPLKMTKNITAAHPPNEELTIRGDHMVMFSAPSALCENLEYVASKY